MRNLIVSFVVAGMLLCGSAEVHSSVIYNYTGLNFTSVTGSGPQVTTSDHISGFVEFATAPTPNETGKNDVTGFSLSDGSRVLSSANGDNHVSNDFFNFDAFLNIVDWQLFTVPDSEVTNSNELSTTPTFDFSRLRAGTIQDARNSGGGTWIGAAPAAIPEPATLALFGLGLAGLGFSRRKLQA